MGNRMRLFWRVLFPAITAVASAATGDVRVDQAGYLPTMPKIAIVRAGDGIDFTVRSVSGNSIVYRGALSAAVTDSDSGETVRSADFTGLEREGKYYLEVPGTGKSWPFEISRNVYRRVFYLAMRAFYGQRCGTAVDLGSEFPGYKHAPCHLTGAYHVSSGKQGEHSSAKGWHDAGDYGRYVVNSGITTGTLLWTWELFADRVRNVSLNLPETGNKIPDMLNEIRWNLDWMLSMQDADGGVWHKQTSEKFSGFIMPEADKLVSYVIGSGTEPFKTTCATADLAAVAAIAGRVYKPFDAAYAQTTTEAARRAWMWATAHPQELFRNNPAGVATGAYGDSNCSDEMLWASAELWRTTREDTYQQYFRQHYRDHLESIRPVNPPSWANVAPLGLWSYAFRNDRDETTAVIRKAALEAAGEIVARSAANAWRISMTRSDYVWGSNGVAASYGMQLLVANAIKPDPRFVKAAVDNLHYLLGRNSLSLSWVTWVGANPYRHPHHRPSGADTNQEPWPGLLSGGPNARRQDPAMQKSPELPPARMYLDEQASYATNEIAINWQAPLVFVLAGALPDSK